MFNALIKTTNYIKYFAFMIAVNSFCDSNAGTLKKWFLFKKDDGTIYTQQQSKQDPKVQSKKIEIPWKDDGDSLADFQCIFKGQIINEENNLITMRSMQGNVVILVFSTTWCPNCPSVIKKMDSLNKKLHGIGVDNVKIIHLNIGDEPISVVKKHLKDMDVDLDAYASVSGGDVGVSVIPSVMIFDKDCKAVCGYIGGSFDYLSDKFVKFIISLARQ